MKVVYWFLAAIVTVIVLLGWGSWPALLCLCAFFVAAMLQDLWAGFFSK